MEEFVVRTTCLNQLGLLLFSAAWFAEVEVGTVIERALEF